MKIGRKGLCIDTAGHIRWSWCYANEVPDFVPPVKLETAADGTVTETPLFDPTDRMVSLDNSDLEDGDVLMLMERQGATRVCIEAGKLCFKECVTLRNGDNIDSVEIDHPIMNKLRAKRAMNKDGGATSVLVRIPTLKEAT